MSKRIWKTTKNFFKYPPYLSGIVFQYKQKFSGLCNAVRMTFIIKWIFAWIERVCWMFWFNKQSVKKLIIKKKDLPIAKMSAMNINTAHKRQLTAVYTKHGYKSLLLSLHL